MRQRFHRQKSVLGTLLLGVAAGGSFALFGARANENTSMQLMTPIETPSLNFYGLPGVIDMPSGYAMPDGTVGIGLTNFAGTTRATLSFQITPRLSAAFRYVRIQDWNSDTFDTYADRNFDVRYLLNKESKVWPAVTIGLQDFAGTGIYAGEYIVASKTFATPRLGGSMASKLRVTAGLGWGRLGSSGGIGSPFGSDRPEFEAGDTGGELSFDQWFRGDMAPFAGVEWQINEDWAVKAEYSSDAYVEETGRAIFDRKSRFNFGAEYKYSDELRLGAYYLYGSEIGLTAQIQLNPRRSVTPLRIPPPMPIAQRPSRAASPELYTERWASAEKAPFVLSDALRPLLEKDGLHLDALSVSGREAELRFKNRRYYSTANAVGRAARSMAQVMPPSVEVFHIVPLSSEALPLSSVTVQRSDLETLEFAPNSVEAILARTEFAEASPVLEDGFVPEDLYPEAGWSLGPYISTSYFDPDQPVRLDLGLALEARYRPAPGWLMSGQLRYLILGNIGDTEREANSALPPVRTDGAQYARESDLYIESLYASRQWKTSDNTYARLTAGYLESMFGGVSAELLWKPQDSRLALGVEANYVQQRDFDRLLGFQDYNVATGHVSAYYDFGAGYLGQIDVGRYLAGDVGATFSVAREFDNGWRVGGFATFTDVSAEDFGEGSFDKGITLTIPLGWFVGDTTKRRETTTIRPIQRDGGARLEVPGRLYDQVREADRDTIIAQGARFWQ